MKQTNDECHVCQVKKSAFQIYCPGFWRATCTWAWRHAFAYHPLSVLPFVEESPPLLSTNFATRGVLERERHAATNVLCRGRIPKQEPQKIPNTIISTMINVLPPTATFQTYMQENKRRDLIFLLRKAIQKLSKLQEIVQLVHSHA